tara:strand:+ start:1928 stop:3637 length:1710 start_codon:yes stop_codon:yes gene_type:complete
MKILIYVGYQKESVNKEYWLSKGMGGSEYCVMKLSEQFANNGHDVTITGGITDQDVDGVKYRSIESFINSGENYFDIVISTNYIHYIQMLEDFEIDYGKSYFWIHNEEFYTWYNGVELPNEGLDYLNHDKLDKIIAVSEWQKNILVEKYSLEPSKVSVIGNAISPSDFDDINQEKYKNKVIYTSSPDRGLAQLLDIWPKLKKINPELTLWIAAPPYTKDWDFSLLNTLPLDVRWLGHLPPSELYKQIKSSEYWIYPSTYPETYCITALEMMMGRVKLISTDTANLKTLLDGKCGLIRSDLSEPLMKETIISSYVFLKDNEKVAEKYLNIAEGFARQQTWEVRYNEWMGVIEGVSQNESLNTKRLHPELYNYWNNKEEWVNKFITYSARTKEWDLIVDEPFDNCFSFPLFTPEFCTMIREEAEHSDSWTIDRHENYPTTDMVLQTIEMNDIYNDVLKEFVMPLSIYMWGLEGKGWDSMKAENFLAKYVPTAQGHLSIHHDKADVTCLIQLSDLNEYEGGGTWFRRQKKLIKNNIGYATLHPGNITHKHGARAVTKGTRYIIVSFMENGER